MVYRRNHGRIAKVFCHKTQNPLQTLHTVENVAKIIRISNSGIRPNKGAIGYRQ